jgi:hypothetical protein
MNGCLAGGFSNYASVTVTAQPPPPLPLASAYASITSGWEGVNFETQEVAQLYDATVSVYGSRANSTPSVREHWDTNGNPPLEGAFYYILFDCSAGTSVVVLDARTYLAGSTTTSGGDWTAKVSINSTHYYALRVWGGGTDNSCLGVQAHFSPFPPSGIIPQDITSNCF